MKKRFLLGLLFCVSSLMGSEKDKKNEEKHSIKVFGKHILVKESVLNQFGVYKAEKDLETEKELGKKELKLESQVGEVSKDTEVISWDIKVEVNKETGVISWDITDLVKKNFPELLLLTKKENIVELVKLLLFVAKGETKPEEIESVNTMMQVIKLADVLGNDSLLSLLKTPFIEKITKGKTLSLPLKTFNDKNEDNENIGYYLFLVDENQFLFAAPDGAIRLWDIDTGEVVRKFKGHSGMIMSMLLLPEKNQFLSASVDKTIKLWDMKNGKEIRSFEEHEKAVMLMVLISGENQFLSGAGDIKLWDVNTGKVEKTFKGHKGDIVSLLLLSGQKQFLSGEFYIGSCDIKLWDINTGNEVRTFSGHTRPISRLLLLPGGEQFISSSNDKTVRLWNIENEKAIRVFKGHKGFVNSLLLLPEGMQILTGSRDKTVRLWNVKTGEEVRIFRGHNRPINKMLLLSGGEQFLSSSNDKTIRLWDIEDESAIKVFKGHKNSVTSLSLLPEKKQFLSVSRDGVIKLWSLKPFEKLTFKQLELCYQLFVGTEPVVIDEKDEKNEKELFESLPEELKDLAKKEKRVTILYQEEQEEPGEEDIDE